MVTKTDSNKARLKRHKRVRGKISGTAARPRLCVYRSLDNIYAQIIAETDNAVAVSDNYESCELKDTSTFNCL